MQLQLVDESKAENEKKTVTKDTVEASEKEKVKALDIPEKVVNEILEKLEAFENKALYLKKSLIQNKIAMY